MFVSILDEAEEVKEDMIDVKERERIVGCDSVADLEKSCDASALVA
jgi:hypothetical protein